MDVVDAGLLGETHEYRAIGTPYVTIAVDSWDAADAVRVALEDVAGIDEISWTIDWARSADRFRQITIFPTFD